MLSFGKLFECLYQYYCRFHANRGARHLAFDIKHLSGERQQGGGREEQKHCHFGSLAATGSFELME